MTENQFLEPRPSPKATIGFGKPKGVVPLVEWRVLGACDHFLQFYERDSALVESVSGYFAHGFQDRQAGVVIATQAHREALEAKLRTNGFNIEGLRASRKYLPFDAAETLAKIMVDGSPDPVLFEQVIGGMIAQALRESGRVKAFGEMVALLMADGNQSGTIALEELWNDLAKRYCFTLFCAYPLCGFARESTVPPFEQIRKAHSRVLPVAG